MSASFDRRRFRGNLDPNRSGIFVCLNCSKRTRETGWDESSVQLCKACLFEANRFNLHFDNGHAGKDPNACAICIAEYPVLDSTRNAYIVEGR